jgi:uncharacterized protein YndB with AHSA1/START domain
MTTRKTREIRLEIEIDASPEDVWTAIATPAGVASWFPPFASGGAKVGDKLMFSWGAEMEFPTTIASLEKPTLVRWEDNPAALAALARGEETDGSLLAVDWHIETKAGKTVLRFVQSGFDAAADWDEQYDGMTTGWTYFMFNLKHYVERHNGQSRVVVYARRPTTLPHSEWWRKLLGPDGFGVSDTALDALGSGSSVQVTIDGTTQPLEVAHDGEPFHLWAILPDLGDGLLFVEAEGRREKYTFGVWISLYGEAAARGPAVQSWLNSTVDRVFAENVVAG